MFKRALGLTVLGLVGYLAWWPWFHNLRHANPTHTSLMTLRENQARRQGHKPRSLLIWRPLSRISPQLIHALLLAEDDQFFQHSGFDFDQILVALQRDWKEKRFAYGGSTLTQQLARTLYLSPRKNMLRKAKEALITLWLEHTLPKARILEIYLNVVEWGRGIYGAEAAARHYFQKPASELTADESVALVSILPSPRRWSPFSERSFMARRRTNILEEMRKQGYIDDEIFPHPMKIATWIDRLAGVVLALAIARVLGPQALGAWTLILLTAWILSPWPEGTLATRLGAGVLGLAGVAIVSWLWHGSWDRHALLWMMALGMLSIRIVHALPAPWPWRLLAVAASFLTGLIALGLTKSVLATHTALAIAAGLAALVGCLRYHAALGTFSTISWITWGESLLMMLLQAQAILWVYACGLSESAIGELAAALFLLEFLKGGLVILALRFDAALTHFSQTRESFLETVRSITAYSFLIMPPTVLAVFFATGPLVNGVLGAEFSASVPLIRLLIWGFGLSFLSLMGTRVLAAKHKNVLAARLSAGLLEAALDWLWIPQMGLEGACYGRVVGETTAFILIAFQVCHATPDLINPFRKTFG